jgi:hypothetical protein
MALILDRSTGLASPQFHIKYDHSFHTAEEDDKAGFIYDAEHAEGRIKMRGLSEGAIVGALEGECDARQKKRARPEDDGQVDQQRDLTQHHVLGVPRGNRHRASTSD